MDVARAHRDFVAFCWQLPTWGSLCFTAKEQVQKLDKKGKPTGKPRLANRVVCLNPQWVMSLDDEKGSKNEPTRKWPLSGVQRWTAPPGSLSIDFGEDGIVSFQTTQADAISGLLAELMALAAKKASATISSNDKEKGDGLDSSPTVGKGRWLSPSKGSPKGTPETARKLDSLPSSSTPLRTGKGASALTGVTKALVDGIERAGSVDQKNFHCAHSERVNL